MPSGVIVGGHSNCDMTHLLVLECMLNSSLSVMGGVKQLSLVLIACQKRHQAVGQWSGNTLTITDTWWGSMENGHNKHPVRCRHIATGGLFVMGGMHFCFSIL